jgi:hypothetical protein
MQLVVYAGSTKELKTTSKTLESHGTTLEILLAEFIEMLQTL